MTTPLAYSTWVRAAKLSCETFGARRAQGIGAVAEQCLDDQRDSPERRIFPAAIGVVEKEPGRAMHREDRAEQNRRRRDRDDACPDSVDQRDAGKHFGRDDDISELAPQA